MKKATIGNWFNHLQIQHKIFWGYGLSLGIASIGIASGVILSDYQQRQAAEKSKDAIEELELITSLQVDILQTVIDQKRIATNISNPRSLLENYEEWQKHQKRFRESWEEFKQTRGGTKGQETIEKYGEVEAINAFLNKFVGIPEAYMKEIDQLPFKISSTAITSEEIVRLRIDLTQLGQSSLLEKIDNFSEELSILIPIVKEEYEEAQTDFRNSHILGLWIIGISMFLSLVIATIIAILTSRAIVHPIKSLRDITEQAIKESNFDLQAPVTTKDEIGTLSVSFNKLITSVKTLLNQQSDRNSQLQELLAKLHSTQVQMLQNEKMSSLGQLVAGVAHEINNPVNFIHANLTYLQEYTYNLLNFIRLYQKHYPDAVAEIDREAEDIDLEFLQTDIPKLLASMQIGTDRIREIVVSLRNFSRTDQTGSKAINIHEGIDSTLLILQHRLKADAHKPEIKVICNYGSLPLVECYPGQLNQVFMNILANAIDALEESNAKLTHQEILDHPSQIEISTSIIDPQWIQITISDNGIGMSEATRKQIFDPFFTTKNIGKGTGMGMAISYQIITEKHCGKLECHSTIGEGTQFIIQIPVQQLVPDVT